MLKAIIVDDEWYTLEEIKSLAEGTGFIQVCGAYENPLEALQEAKEVLPRAAFVDIEMPEMDGITLAERLLENDPYIYIVFITAYNHYAVQAFDLNALDYILKPINTERFARMAGRLKKAANIRQNREPLLSIKCFGGFEVTMDGIPVKWGRAKAEELFAYLLANHGRMMHKDAITGELWPEYISAKALPILQTSVCKLRNLFSSLRELVKLEYSSGRYFLSVSGCHCDLYEVENALDSFVAEDKNTYDKIAAACRTMEKGFLAQSGYLWSHAKDMELKERLCRALHRAVECCSSSGDEASAIKFLKLLTRAAPCEEEANSRLMELLIKSGHPEDAYRHYRWLEKVLAEEYCIAPPAAVKKIVKGVTSDDG